jgi:hypothetical protein
LASLFAKKFWRGGEPRLARFAGVLGGVLAKVLCSERFFVVKLW